MTLEFMKSIEQEIVDKVKDAFNRGRNYQAAMDKAAIIDVFNAFHGENINPNIDDILHDLDAAAQRGRGK
jgi:hypothetical protein